MNSTNTCNKALTSRWDGLSPHLIARFYEVAKNNEGVWLKKDGGDVVEAPLTDSSLEMSLNWQSPFENSGADHGMPTVTAMLQSGALQPYFDAAGAGGSSAAQFTQQFAGRTGITKLNSTQVFTGMPPVKIQVTALFRAWEDPAEEVERPFSKLMEWSLPVYLAPEGAILSFLKADMNLQEKAKALLPSTAPVCIALFYKGRTYSPLVIESIGQPMNSPVDRQGNFVELLVPMTLCTLTAIDRSGWADTRRSEF